MKTHFLTFLLAIACCSSAQALTLKDFRFPITETVSSQRDDFVACEISLQQKRAPSEQDRERMNAVVRETEVFAEKFKQAEDTQRFAETHREEAKALVAKVNALLAELELEVVDELTLTEARLAPALVRSYLGYVPTLQELNDLITDLRRMGNELVAKEEFSQEEYIHLKWDLALLQQISFLAELRDPALSLEYDDLMKTFMTIHSRFQAAKRPS